MAETLSQIGRYKILGELGRGGFGRVYRAYDASVSRQLAIKLLTESSKEVLARFRNEAQVVGNLRHENIVTVYEYGEHEGQPFLAMEYLEGEDLHQILTARKRLTLLEKCEIMSQVAAGLYCAHRSGVIHRDVKPANIMVLADGRVKIMDFGIARVKQGREATRLTQEGWLIGTVLYMAPEQFGGGDVDSLTDIFAYGVVFYELLAGQHPFEAPDSRRLMYNISFTDPPPVSTLVPECPEALDRMIRRLLAKDREVRYQSLKDVLFDLELVLTDLRRQRAEELVEQAQRQVDKKELESAQSLVGEALRLDASHRVARSLHGSLQRQLQQRALQPRIEALMAAGEEQLAHRRFAESVQSFESALKLDRDSIAIQGRLAFARGLLERSRTAASLVVEAQTELDKLNLTLASRKAADALRHDPENTAATELIARIQLEMENRQREQRIDAAVRRAEGLVLLRSYSEAIELLEGLGEDAKSAKVERLLSWLRAEEQERERKERLKAEMSAATELLRARRLDEAVSCLEALQKSYPEEQEVAHLLAYARKELLAQARARAVDELAERANALLGAEDFPEALALLENGLKQYPGEIKLIRLLGSGMSAKAAWARRHAVGAAIREASQLREQRRYPEAIELVEAALRDFSSDPALLELLEQLEQDWTRKRREDAVRKALEQAGSLLERGEPFEAQQQILQALIQYPGEEALLQLLRRAEAEGLSLEKARAIDAITRESSLRMEAQDFAGALAAIDQGLQKWPGDTALLALRRQAASSEAEWKRRTEIQTASQRAAELAAAGKFAEALSLLAEARRNYPDESQLDQLEVRIGLDWERHQRREAVRGVLSEARLLLVRARLDEAADVLKDALSRYPGEADLEALSVQVRDAIEARERALAVERLSRESQALLAEARFDDARAALEQGLAAFPGEPELLNQLESVKAARAEWERRQAIEQAISEAARLASDCRFDQALAALSIPGVSSPALEEARARVERERSEHDRRAAIENGAADSAALIDNGQPEEALKLLQQLASRYQRESHWPPLIARAQAAVAERKAADERRRAIEQTVRECEQLTALNRFEQAFERLHKTLERYPGDDALLECEERLKLRREAYRRAQAVEQAAARAEALIDADRLEEALAALTHSCAEYPAEAALRSLLARAERALEARREIERALREGGELLEAGRFEDALLLLERTLAAYPGNPNLAQLTAAAREKLDLRRRDEAIAAIAEGASSVAQARDFDRALLMIERGLEKWPRNQRLLGLQHSVSAEREQWQREQFRRQTVEDLQQLLRQERYSEAYQRVEKTLEAYPGDPDLLRIKNECAAREILAQAAAAGAAGRPQEGLRLMEQSAPGHAGRPEWTELENRLREQFATLERNAAVRKAAQEARDLAARNDFDGAFQLLTRAGQQFPNEPELDNASRAVAELKAAYDRRAAIESRTAACVRLADSGHLREAVAFASQALEEFPNEPALLAVRKRLDEQLQELERRRRREQDLDELRALDESIARTAGSESLSEIRGVAERIVAQYPRDEEIRSAAAAPLQHLSDIERAKRALLQRDFEGALQLCRQYLPRFPEHATFHPLEKDAERGRRAADLEQTRRRADDETDLVARGKLLEDAASRYPDEASLQSELQFTRNKLALVESIVAAARAQEAAGSWEQALEQWNKLATIYSKYPGLTAEMEKVRAARAQAEAAAAARWTAQIEPLVEAGDFEKARDAVTRAVSELPGAAGLRDLSRKIDELRENQRRIRELLRGLRALREGGKWEQFTANAGEALQLSAGHRKLRGTVLEKVIEQARALGDIEWRKTEALIGLLQSWEPRYAAPEELQQTIAKGKRQAAIDAALQNSQQLRAQGKLRDALAELERALAQFADDSRLQAARRSLEEELRKKRASITAELNEIRETSERAATASELDPLTARVAAITSGQADPDISTLAGETARAITSRRRQLTREQVSKALRVYGKPAAIAAAAAAALLFAWLGFRGGRGVSVSIASNISGATVAVGNANCVTPQCVLSLKPGAYTLSARKTGFQPITVPFTVGAGKSELSVPISFQPLAEQLQVNANFESGSVYLDGRLAGALQNSQFSLSGLAPGAHDIRVTDGDAEFSAQWRSVAGEQPVLLGPVSARNVQAAVVADVGGAGSIACNCDVSKTLVDGAPAGAPQGNGTTALPRLAEGTRQISIDGRNIVVDVRSNPALNIFLTADRNVGVLVIHAGVDDAKVYLNNHLYARRTEQGVLRAPVPVGEYSIRVEKENFRSPAPLTANVGKGEEKQVSFTLAPALSTLEIAGAQPRAQIKIDGNAIGETDAKGRFRGEVTPGTHTVELSKNGFAPARFEAQFAAAREPVRPGPAQLAMAKLPVGAPPPAPAPAPAPATAAETKKADPEAQDWAAVAGSSRVEDFQDYLRKHPSGTHAGEAQSRIDQLQQADAARKDDADWNAIDKNNKAALQDYLSRHNGGRHAQDAHSQLDAIQKQETDAAAAAERDKNLKRAAQAQADIQAVQSTLSEFVAANNKMDARAIAQIHVAPIPQVYTAKYFQQFRSLTYQLTPTAAPAVNGDSATVTCNRSTSALAKSGDKVSPPTDRVRVALTRVGSRWMIQSIMPF